MQAERRNLLASDLRVYVRAQLDAEPGWTGEDAGRVAAVVERAFVAAVRAIDPEAVRGPGTGPELFCEFCGSGPECIVCGRGRP